MSRPLNHDWRKQLARRNLCPNYTWPVCPSSLFLYYSLKSFISVEYALVHLLFIVNIESESAKNCVRNNKNCWHC